MFHKNGDGNLMITRKKILKHEKHFSCLLISQLQRGSVPLNATDFRDHSVQCCEQANLIHFEILVKLKKKNMQNLNQLCYLFFCKETGI